MSFKIYTWKDVERKVKLYLNSHHCDFINSIDVYSAEIVVSVNQEGRIDDVDNIFSELFGVSYDLDNKLIKLDQFEISIYIEIEIEDKRKNSPKSIPLFRDIIFKNTAYSTNIIESNLPGRCPIIAFHSYKGGVGRTLSLLAFAKAWSANSPEDKLLLIDSDIEAPGITWLLNQEHSEGDVFSYLDLMEFIQASLLDEEKLEQIIDMIASTTMKIDTGERMIEHFVMPTYRYQEQLLDIYSNPESIARGYKNRYLLAEVLSDIGERLGVSAILVDLRAGVSEFSAPLLFDPRVKKYIVTSTSFQSVQGTKMLLAQICKGLPIGPNAVLPEIFFTMVQENINTVDIKSSLLEEYNSDVDRDDSYTDNLITELPFTDELLHLSSFRNIMKKLDGRDMYFNINRLVKENYLAESECGMVIKDREEVIHAIYNLADSQITAEGNEEFNVLLTQPIHMMIKKYWNSIPQIVVLGAKGAGKTFLFREMLRNRTWQNFIQMGSDKEINRVSYVIPLVSPKNTENLTDIIQKAVKNFRSKFTFATDNLSFWYDNRIEILSYKSQYHDLVEWSIFWKKIILNAFKNVVDLIDVDKALQKENSQVIFVVDGLEEIFENTLSENSEKNAICSLVQELMTEVKIKYKNIGLVVYLRKDLANNSITVNQEQFENAYKPYALNWSHEEALRLALWLVNRAVPGFYTNTIAIEQASHEVIDKSLSKLWGIKLGKSNSNEAFSSRWILAALSDFNSQLQARDIIRFLANATEKVGKKVYEDRYIMPMEIKNAVQQCSKAKIDEIKQEIGVLRPILEELEQADEDKKILPFESDTFHWSVQQEKSLRQEGLLIVDDGKYYLPEIIRHALKFRYKKGARPKVLSLLLKK